MKCETCTNYIKRLETCKFCHYEEDHNISSSFDIFKFLDQDDWVHIELTKYLHDHNIQCAYCDVWDNDLLIIIGCNNFPSRISQVLGVKRECIYTNDSGLLIINLFQEKYLRGIEKI